MDFSKLIDWLKLSPRYLLPIWLAALFLIVAPAGLLSVLRLVSFMSVASPYVSLVFFVSSFLLVVNALYPRIEHLQKASNERVRLKPLQRRLHQLTEAEKSALREYITMETRTRYFDFEGDNDTLHGVVGGLVKAEVLYAVTSGKYFDSRRRTFVGYNMEDWADGVQ